MRRWFVRLVSLVSLLLLVAAVAAWIRSYQRIDEISGARDGIAYFIVSAAGDLSLIRADRDVASWSWGWQSYTLPPNLTRAHTYKRGTVRFDAFAVCWLKSRSWAMTFPFGQPAAVTVSRGRVPPEIAFQYPSQLIGSKFDALIIPYWAMILATLPLPAWRSAVAARRIYRRRRGCCLNCGYDLRSSPDRCPECGLVAGAPRPRI